MQALHSVAFLVVASLPAQAEAPREFEDPAPPQLVELARVAAPAMAPYPELTVGVAAKPLPADGIVEDWPGFLGPRRDGVSRETGLLEGWAVGGPALVWSCERGEGFASPAVAGGYLVFPHREGGETLVDCLDPETGQRFWRFRFETDYSGRYISNAGPCATPYIDGERVFVHGVEGKLFCLELSTGRVVWRRDLAAEFELTDGFFGVVSSPLVWGDLLILNLGAPSGPSVAAFDKANGKLVWGTGSEWGASCASPVVAEIHGESKLLVLTGGDSRPPMGGLMVLDPATGAFHSKFSFRSRTYESVNGATPVVAGSRVFLTAAYGVGTAALDLSEDWQPECVWARRRFGLEFATPLLIDGHLYAVHGVRERAGGVVCLDPASGEELNRTDLDWEETVPYKGEDRVMSFSVGNGCMIWADGAFLCLGDQGHLLRLECRPDGTRVLDRARLFGASESWTPPVLSRGLLYVCQNNRERFGEAPRRLLCYDLRAAE